MTLVVFTSLLAIFIVTFYFYVKFKYSYWKRRGVPYIEPSIPFGNFGPNCWLGQNIHDLYNASADPIVGVYLALRPALIVRDPKIIQDVLIKDFQYFCDRGFHFDSNVDPLIANLFFSDANWKKMRSKLSPAFTSVKLKGMFETFLGCAEHLEECVKHYAITGKEVEVRELFSRYTMNAIASVGFGLEIDSFKDPNNEFRKKGLRYFEPNIKTPWRLSMSFISPFLTKLLRIRLLDKDVSDFMVETVRQNLEYRETNNIVRKDFFQQLIQIRNSSGNEKSLSVKNIAAEAFLFNIAGYESSSSTMTFLLLELAKNPVVQQKVYEEIRNTTQKYNGNLSYEALGEMKYLESCIDETLRIHPPFDLLYRVCVKDYKVANLNISIEKGTPIFFSVTGSQSDPKYYPNPDKFEPERFLDDENFTKNSTEAPYLTFGAGPRNCIGLRLGKLQAKIGICILLSKFSFELGAKHTNDELKLDSKAVVRTVVGGVNLKIKCR